MLSVNEHVQYKSLHINHIDLQHFDAIFLSIYKCYHIQMSWLYESVINFKNRFVYPSQQRCIKSKTTSSTTFIYLCKIVGPLIPQNTVLFVILIDFKQDS